ncbi:MAG: hypothetical protein GC201_12185 [Alphaproteobacteria bacterium]|nr:hypothetical protein [Alphaproteobacteria bacterium]
MLDLIYKLSEILAAIAVIVSLVFVSIQLRNNTKAVRASMAQASVAIWADNALAVATTSDLMDALRADHFPMRTPLTKDQFKVAWYVNLTLKNFEFNYLQWLDGNLSDDIWDGARFAMLDQFASLQSYERSWPFARGYYSSKFETLVNQQIIPEARAKRAKSRRDYPDQVVPS